MTTTTPDDTTFRSIPVELIDEPSLPTRFLADDDSVHELAQNIRAVGLLQPIVVTQNGARFRLVAGNRRLRAVKLLGQDHIAAHVISLSRPNEALATIAENLRREQLHPLEEATAVVQLLQDHGLTHEQLAEMLGVDRTWVGRRVQLVHLPADLQDATVLRNLDASTALELARIDEPQDRTYYTNMVLDGGASLQTVRQWMRDYLTGRAAPQDGSAVQPPRGTPGPTPVLRAPCCHVCSKTPPEVALRIVYLCWTCEAALKGAQDDQAGD